MLHISPEADGAGEVFPHSFVFPNAFLAFIYKMSYAVLLYLIFSVKTEQFFNFYFNRKTVCVPAGFARNIIAFHGAVPRYHILDNSRKNVTYMRFAVSCGGTVIKGVNS